MPTGSLALAFALSALAQTQQIPQEDPLSQARFFIEGDFPVPGVEDAMVKVFHDLSPLDIPKISPKHEWEFRFVSNGLVKTPEREDYGLRFRVFAQSRRADHDDVAQWATRMLVRLWSYNYYKLGRDHPEAYRRIVDFYLCFGGDAGGEHLFDIDRGDLDSGNRSVRVNTCYIYQIGLLQNPFQLARELAHEYGHATLPAVGIYAQPENWANGDIGERIYLKWLHDDLKAGRLRTFDMVNVDPEILENYVKTRVEPLVVKITHTGPNLATLAQKHVTPKPHEKNEEDKTDAPKTDQPGNLRSKAAFDEYVALAVFAANFLPPKSFNRAMELGSQDPLEFEKSIREVTAELKSLEFEIPDYLKGKALYLPVGDKTVTGGKILQRKGDWVKIQPTSPTLSFTQTAP